MSTQIIQLPIAHCIPLDKECFVLANDLEYIVGMFAEKVSYYDFEILSYTAGMDQFQLKMESKAVQDNTDIVEWYRNLKIELEIYRLCEYEKEAEIVENALNHPIFTDEIKLIYSLTNIA